MNRTHVIIAALVVIILGAITFFWQTGKREVRLEEGPVKVGVLHSQNEWEVFLQDLYKGWGNNWANLGNSN